MKSDRLKLMPRLILVFLFLSFCWAADTVRKVEFSRDIRPIFSDKCFTCHGPDEANRKAKLRLDIEAEAKHARGTKTPVLAGNAAASEVVKRISSESAGLRMPPSYAGHKKLSEKEIALIGDWINQGAKWQSHWAFVAPQRPELPVVKNKPWVRNEIDSFVLARLEKESLRPSKEVSRERLLRRVSFDLTGLPPTPSDIDAFIHDKSPKAYEKVVDKLLASSAYGENMAVAWLDAARYADTHGYQVDPGKEMWAWRDWVIQAFNRNMPFDQFTVEQLAGDLLPGATMQQKIATGFGRNHRVNTESGSIAEEYHAENVIDRMTTSGTVWLGLTVGCARCHDHKYDPITARDFYSMYAFFNNVEEIGTGGAKDGRGNLKPYLKLPAPEINQRLATAEVASKKVREELKQLDEKLEAGFASWDTTAKTNWRTMVPQRVTSESGVSFAVQDDGSVLASGTLPNKDIYQFNAEMDVKNITAFRLELLPDATLPAGGSGRGKEGFGVLTMFEVKLDGKPVELAKITADFSPEGSVPDSVLRPKPQIKDGWFVTPEVTKPHFVVIEPRKVLRVSGNKRFTIRIGNQFGESALLGRFRISITDGEFPEPMPANVKAALANPNALVKRFYTSHLHAHREVADRLGDLEIKRRAVEAEVPSTMVMSEMEKPRDAFILMRGDYSKPGAKVTAAVPSFLPPLPPGAPANRLGFAKWLIDPSHPLTARVAVNRFWQSYFGTGLVKTSEDFGSQGESPSHPELLDWLATEFIRSGWDVKAMQKMIVMSATYRQTSVATPALTERDPENRLLARGPRFRLGAEAIRDQALKVSGLLSIKEGGEPVKPYQPAGVWEQLSVIDDKVLYVQSKGEDLWRRSLYTFWKRTVPPPALTTFDAPSREFCVIRRSRSTTPLQALVLLNDETYVEASRKLAERMLKEGGKRTSDRIGYGFRLAASRFPTAKELAVLSAGLERRLAEYQSSGKQADSLIRQGDAPRDESLNPSELAAYTTLASVILNLDEVITKQ